MVKPRQGEGLGGAQARSGEESYGVARVFLKAFEREGRGALEGRTGNPGRVGGERVKHAGGTVVLHGF